MRISAFLLTLLMFVSQPLWASTQQLLQLIDYVGVDYAGAVSDGQVVNQGEYAEMADFAAGIAQQINDLPQHSIKSDLQANAQRLLALIKQKASARQIKQLSLQMHQAIIDAYQVTVVPRTPPDLQQAAVLYAENCASCHGAGPESVNMEPPPINFHDRQRYQ